MSHDNTRPRPRPVPGIWIAAWLGHGGLPPGFDAPAARPGLPAAVPLPTRAPGGTWQAAARKLAAWLHPAACAGGQA